MLIHSMVRSFYQAPSTGLGTVPGPGTTAVNKTDRHPRPHGADVLAVGRKTINLINRKMKQNVGR